MAGTKGGKKTRKIGRNKEWCKRYSLGMQEMKNRKRRLRRTVKAQPCNEDVVKRYEKEFGEFDAGDLTRLRDKPSKYWKKKTNVAVLRAERKEQYERRKAHTKLVESGVLQA